MGIEETLIIDENGKIEFIQEDFSPLEFLFKDKNIRRLKHGNKNN